MGLIQAAVAARVGDNLVALLTKGNSVYALAALMLALTLGGCAPSADIESEPFGAITVSGPACAASLLTAGEASTITKPHEVIASTYEMPFVRSQPRAVPPFPLVLNRTVQHYVNQYVSQPQGLKQSFR